MNTTKSIKIGYSMSLTGPLGANGQTALLAHRIDSLAEFEPHLRASGATILQPPAPTPAGRNMVVRDVDGVAFELVEPRSPG